jgi:hypothetical protein
MLSSIVGLCFVIISLGMIILHEYYSAVFIFMVVFVLLQPISNLIESELNISVSGAVIFLVVINPFSRIGCGRTEFFIFGDY